MTPGWQREAWEQLVADAGLPAGAVLTAQALARMADERGIAAPGLAVLAEACHCSMDTAHRRLLRLEQARFARRRGRVSGVLPRSAVIRWQLTVPVDVGHALPGGGYS